MINNKAKPAIGGYFFSFTVSFFASVITIYFNFTSLLANTVIYAIFLVNIALLIRLFYKKNEEFQIAIRAALLGYVFALGIYIKFMSPPFIQVFGGYMCILAFFHFSEFVTMALIQPREVTTDAFMLYHSGAYVTASVVSWMEFFVEAYFFPEIKIIYWLSNIGICICIAGEILRKTAMFTANSNFNHLVQFEKSTDHVLVTHGVYSWFRHPSYVGWFYWSIATQIILLNPVCVITYAIVSWAFFNERIYMEEITLLNFFGQSYCDYQDKVWTGIPFIRGYTFNYNTYTSPSHLR